MTPVAAARQAAARASSVAAARQAAARASPVAAVRQAAERATPKALAASATGLSGSATAAIPPKRASTKALAASATGLDRSAGIPTFKKHLPRKFVASRLHESFIIRFPAGPLDQIGGQSGFIKVATNLLIRSSRKMT